MTDSQKSEHSFELFEKEVHAALETYSNVHRGSGYKSMETTRLFEQAREIVLEYLGLSKRKYAIIFCTSRRAEVLKARLDPGNFQIISSREFGLAMGVSALAVKRNAIPRDLQFDSGGGTARLISRDWVIWEKTPERFEAGTPAIINIIALAKALQLIRQNGISDFRNLPADPRSADEIIFRDELEKFSGKEHLDKLKKTLIGRDVRVKTPGGDKPFINFDNAASTPTFTPVYSAAMQALRQTARVQQELTTRVRSVCAGFLNAPLADYDVVFTSNTTEGINLVAESLSHEERRDIEPVIINTLLEHNSNDLPWRMIPGFSLLRLPIDEHGFFDLEELKKILCLYNHDHQHGKKRIRLVAVSGASNVLGIYNNLLEISRIVHTYGARLLVDGAQMVAHREIDTKEWGIDYLVFSAHKVYAPFGCGVLIARKGLLGFTAEKLELILRSGEENAMGIAALGKSLVLLERTGMDLIQKEEQELTRGLLVGLSRIPGITIYGVSDPDSPEFEHKGGVVVFILKGMMANTLAKKLSRGAGIGMRSGCHCSHILIKYLLHVPHWLQQFQYYFVRLVPWINLPGVARVSLGIGNNKEEVETFITALQNIR